MCPDLSDPTQHALASIFKATVVKASQVLRPLAERCGWQGLFAYNQISELDLTFQGNAIAEGDTLVLCIHLYVTAPITSDKSWESFMNSLQAFKSPEEFITPLSKL
ncbi:hypothetical protein HZS61_008849 [Fusarium oxysporum f. sp. conglutinans]|uniref:Uncharacterized protein n=1 Tax=Fusarium oxysporum f. sp. conglutinans TaxID=100902 RepID=A0A8H6H3L6_FUSOX|nr:hypothetical protein HZS61_008849 [Fusarium oxysporum f. sp. conglutinans]